jgi:hypothetical protein
MAKILDWDDYIGRRLRLRDLRVFFAVAQYGSMAKAAAQLRGRYPTMVTAISSNRVRCDATSSAKAAVNVVHEHASAKP